MAIIVVLFNRLFWRRMYNLSEEKYHLEWNYVFTRS
jgi:ABC-type anion transport system duplicated permease subunit